MDLQQLIDLVTRIGPSSALGAALFAIIYWMYPGVFPGLPRDEYLQLIIAGGVIGWALPCLITSLCRFFHYFSKK